MVARAAAPPRSAPFSSPSASPRFSRADRTCSHGFDMSPSDSASAAQPSLPRGTPVSATPCPWREPQALPTSPASAWTPCLLQRLHLLLQTFASEYVLLPLFPVSGKGPPCRSNQLPGGHPGHTLRVTLSVHRPVLLLPPSSHFSGMS